MESYIVRIYRRDDKHPDKIAGLVVFAGSQEQKSFGNYQELWDILSVSGAEKPPGSKKAGPRGK